MLNVGLAFIGLTLIGNIFDGSTPPRNFLIDLCIIGLFLFLRLLLFSGRVQLVAYLIIIGAFAFQALSMASEGTILAPTTALFSLLVIVAGILFNLWGIVVATITSSLVVAGLILARNAGILSPPHFAETTFQWFMFTITFTATGGLAYFSQQQARKTLSLAEKEIKKRLRAETELRKLTRAVEQSPASIVITDLDGAIEYVNPRFSLVTGYSYDEAIGNNPSILKTDQTPPETHRLLWETLSAGKEWQGEFVNRRKDGSTYNELATISPIMDTNGATTQYLAVKEDITERKRSEERLEQSFKENRELLRELQHRAKNSFNMISSMIHLASGEEGSSETLAALDQLNARVLSVAELYSLLYSSGSFTEVRLDEYCGKLASALVGLRPDISLVTDLEAVVVTANRAAPIGLIATELITNSLKYAFPGGRKGSVTVSLRNGPDRAVLAVRDDGVGLPPGFRASDASGMGIKLVTGLAKQAGGTFAIAGDQGGTICTLQFAAEGA